MVDSTTVTLQYSYAPLAPGSEPHELAQAARRTKRPLKVGLAVLSGLMILALMMGMVDYTEKANVGNVVEPDRSTYDSSLRPPPDNVASVEVVPGSKDVVFKVTRGKPHGVSEKANGLPLRGVRTPFFDWNDLQLSWQRTAFHFQPQNNWMNDPNGPLYYNGLYHFFYQYNPGGAVWGNIVWGHAVSEDLIRWTHLPLAMVADQWYDFNGVWTGSATILPGGQIVMLYTGSTNESVQVQNVAYPADLSDPLLRKWVKYPGNPVLVPPPGIDKKDFRDPTTAWLTSEGKWRISIGSKMNKTGISLVYETTDFKSYELLDSILHDVPGTGMWECVDFYPVSMSESNGLDTSVKGPLVKHVLKASMDDDRQDYYALGTYNEANVSWIPDQPSLDVGIGLRYDYGGLFYAAKTFYDQKKQRRILWGWMPEGDSEAADVKKGWSAVQAIPRTVLYDQKTGFFLLQWPVEEVETLRHGQQEFENVVLRPGTVVPLKVDDATQMDIVAEFSIDPKALERLPISNELYTCPSGGSARQGALGPFGFSVLADKHLTEHTPVYFYIVKTSDPRFPLRTFFCTDLSRSSIAPDVRKGIYGTTVPVLEGEKLSMRILVDHSIVEAFAQGGRKAITTRVYPTRAIYKDAKLFLFNNATEATVTASIKTWQMSSARMLFYSVWIHLTIILSAFLMIV